VDYPVTQVTLIETDEIYWPVLISTSIQI